MANHRLTRTRRVTAIFLALGVSLAVTGCSGGSSTDKPQTAATAPATPFLLDVKVAAQDTNVVLTGTTNLPDAALVTIGVTRNVKYKDDDEARAVMIANDGVKVSDGKFRADLSTSEYAQINSNVESFGSIEAVADTIIGCAQIRSNDTSESPQPPAVARAMGKDGKFLESSPQKQMFGAALNLEASETFFFPSPDLARLGASHKKTVGKPFCTL